jgi:hypothetical protein
LTAGTPIIWLSQLVFEAHGRSENRLAPASWDPLQEKRGRRIARAVRLGCKRYWHEFTPPLPHEKEKPTTIDGRVVVGLAGIGASLEDGDIDLSKLSPTEVEQMARYAINELNGFAWWLPQLARHHPDQVGGVLNQCVRGEWQFAADRKDVHEVLNDLVWHGQGLIQLVKPTILELLREGDPPNRSVLQYALEALFVDDDSAAADVQAIARERLKTVAPSTPQFWLWFPLLIQLDAQGGLDVLEPLLSASAAPDQLMVRVCSSLRGRPFGSGNAATLRKPDYMNPEFLRRFIPLVYQYISIAEDVDRSGRGVYTPDERDNAQDFRNGLLMRLAATDTAKAHEVLRELRERPVLAPVRDWIFMLLDRTTERMVQLAPWTAGDIRSFATEHEIDPKTDRDLFTICLKRLRDIRRDVEAADISLREQVRPGDKEGVLRRWLALKLRERSRNRYTVPQEAEIDMGQRPDLRIEHPNTAPASIEIKWAEKWTVTELLERLENQLVGQYMRAHNSRHGVYVLGTVEPRHSWKHPESGTNLSFEEIVEIVRTRADELQAARTDVDRVAVVSIDFRNPKDLRALRVKTEPAGLAPSAS